MIPLTRPTGNGLAPAITSENAVEMAQRSAVKRKENKEKAEKDMAILVAAARQVRDALPGRADLAPMAEAIVMKMAVAVLSGEIAPRSAAEATNIARAWREILSLEQGTPTEIHELRDRAKLLDKFAELREKVEERKGTAIVTTAQEEP